MQNVKIVKRICLPYEFLDTNIKTHIVDYIKNNLQGDCTKDYGYITKINCENEELEIIDHEISRISSDLLFTVSFHAETINPKKGDIIKGEVCMIFSDGIFVNVEDRLKILIPITNLQDYSYEEEENIFSKKDYTVKVGDIVEVIIQASMFNKKKINCFGLLKEM